MICTRPPMGWNSWDCYGPAVTEEIVRKNADFMAKHLKKYGWEYIVVDIQWYEPGAVTHDYRPFADLTMDGYGRLLPAPNRFPSASNGQGFKPLSEYVHSLGLKFGIHIMRGIPRQAVHRNCPILGSTHTAREIAKTDSICHWNTDMYGVDETKPGARAYYDSLFALYAQWGVDFIKCDDICRELPHEEGELRLLSESLQGCGRDMVLSLSPGPALPEKAELYKETANMWRITDDFWDKWELLYNMFERAEKWCIHAGNGHYPDADMLPIGPILQDYDPANRTHFTRDEQKTMLTLWSIFRSPLMIGGEMTGFDDFTMSLLTNEALLTMHRTARHSHPLWRKSVDGSECTAWMALGAAGETYVALFNLGATVATVHFPLSDGELEGVWDAVELWTGAETPAATALTAVLPAHGTAVYRLRRIG